MKKDIYIIKVIFVLEDTMSKSNIDTIRLSKEMLLERKLKASPNGKIITYIVPNPTAC